MLGEYGFTCMCRGCIMPAESDAVLTRILSATRQLAEDYDIYRLPTSPSHNWKQTLMRCEEITADIDKAGLEAIYCYFLVITVILHAASQLGKKELVDKYKALRKAWLLADSGGVFPGISV